MTPLDKYRPGRFAGFGAKCPHCGQPESHGLPGNPAKRKAPPCLAILTTTTLPLASDEPRAARRRAAKRAQRSRLDPAGGDC